MQIFTKAAIRAIAAFAGLALAMPALAGDQANDPAPQVVPGMVEWTLPPAPRHLPQSDAQEEFNRQHGRPLPRPELLQPALDPDLPDYQPVPSGSLSGHFVARASDILPGLVQSWITAFEQQYPGVHIDLQKPYAGSLGALELIKGTIDMVFVSRELKPTDISSFHARYGYDPLSVPVSGGTWRHFGFLDSLAVMVHPGNPIRHLTYAQLDAILSTTDYRGHAPIRTWGDLGLKGEWADKPIHVYAIKPWNGFEEFVRQRVLSVAGKRGEWRTDIHFDRTFFPLARRVAADRYALGYTGMSVVDSRVKVVPISVSDDGPFTSPDYADVAAARYPLTRLVYINLNRRPRSALDPALEEFVKFILSKQGQAIVRQQGIFLPLRAHQQQAAQQLVN